MNKAEQLIAEANWMAAQRGVLSTWTVYDHPRDHPDVFVARRFEIGKGNPEPIPTGDVVAAHELETLRAAFLRAGLTVIPRFEADEPKIVEVWL